MRVRIDPDSPTPASEQLRSAFDRAIATGRLVAGERLPTVRGLAEELGLAPNTVAKAYRALEADGLIEGRGRAGTFVVDAPASRDPGALLADAASAYVRRAHELGFDDAAARAAVRRAANR